MSDVFDDIIQKAIEEANRIKCSPSRYRSGLRGWKEEIEIAVNASLELDPDRDRTDEG
jgi:hypothetical protein